MGVLTEEQRKDIVRYRMENAQNTLEEVKSHRENGYYNTAINRMYYACYYAASALLIANGIVTKSHDGVRQQLGLKLRSYRKNHSGAGKILQSSFFKAFFRRLRGLYQSYLVNC